VDEAILLADRVVMMTNGPQATIGKITDVKLPRPRTRKALLEHPDYYTYRAEVLDFLEEYEHGDPSKRALQTAHKPKPTMAAE
jgi:nitrate/nitrite transport system ATP-binding protein